MKINVEYIYNVFAMFTKLDPSVLLSYNHRHDSVFYRVII